MPVIDVMLLLATQTRHRQLQLLGVPHGDRLGPYARFHPFPLQPRRDRVDVVLHLDGAPLADTHAQPNQTLQAPGRQVTQLRHFFFAPLSSAQVLPILHYLQEGCVPIPARKIPAATQQQGLLDRLLETPMRLLAIAVFMAACWVGRFTCNAVMSQQSLVVPREYLRVAVGMHGQSHAVGAMSLWHASQGPQRVLQTFAQAGETLRKTDRYVFPVRVGQHEVIHHVIETLSQDGHFKFVHVREVRRSEPARLMYLAEENLLGRPRQRPPLLDPPLQSPQQLIAELAGIAILQQHEQCLGLQTRSPFELCLQFRPNRRQRIEPRPPAPIRTSLFGHLSLPIFGRRLAIHPRFESRSLQRRAAL